MFESNKAITPENRASDYYTKNLYSHRIIYCHNKFPFSKQISNLTKETAPLCNYLVIDIPTN